jgi:hypothetical protein
MIFNLKYKVSKLKMSSSQYLVFSVVGMKYYGNHEFCLNDEEHITLKKESNNTHDRNAIKVLVKNNHVAYISSEDNIKVNKFLKKNKEEQKQVDIEFFSSSEHRATFMLKGIQSNNQVTIQS